MLISLVCTLEVIIRLSAKFAEKTANCTKDSAVLSKVFCCKKIAKRSEKMVYRSKVKQSQIDIEVEQR